MIITLQESMSSGYLVEMQTPSQIVIGRWESKVTATFYRLTTDQKQAECYDAKQLRWMPNPYPTPRKTHIR